MSTAEITFKRIDKTVEKQSIQVFRKISNLIENQSRSTKTNTKQEIYKNKEDMQKSSEAKRSKQQTFDEEDNYQKKQKEGNQSFSHIINQYVNS